MDIRLIALYIYVAILSVYAWKDWFKSLCGLILLTVVIGHPVFPESFEGIQGLNLWNIVFANVFLAWLVNRRRQGLLWDMPRSINIFLLLWLGVILVGFVRMMVDSSQMVGFTVTHLVSEKLINTIKWPIVGLLLFDGCRTRPRVKVAIACILLLFALFTTRIARSVPSGDVLKSHGPENRGNLDTDVGLSPNTAGKMMSGVAGAMLAIIPILKKRKYRFFMLGACVASIYTLTLTGSRSGYIACVATIVLLCFLRWRRYLLLLPLIMVFVLPRTLPGATKRMWSGFGVTNVAGEEITDKNTVTSGRNMIWPVVIDKIYESPFFGFGRESMRRTGLQRKLENQYEGEGIAVAHPHNAYLEVLLDSGLFGFVIIVGLHALILLYSARLFVDRGDPLCTIAGGLALALLTGHLVAHMGGQTFYPREIEVGLWCAIGVMLRVYVARGCLVAKVNGASAADIRITKDITVSQTPFGWVNS